MDSIFSVRNGIERMSMSMRRLVSQQLSPKNTVATNGYVGYRSQICIHPEKLVATAGELQAASGRQKEYGLLFGASRR